MKLLTQDEIDASTERVRKFILNRDKYFFKWLSDLYKVEEYDKRLNSEEKDDWLYDLRHEVLDHFDDCISANDLAVCGEELLLRALRCYQKPFKRRLKSALSDGQSSRYRKWRIAVFERDLYTCRECGINKNLHAHHIKPQSEFPELRFVIDNGITLCKSCHAKKHPENSLLTGGVN